MHRRSLLLLGVSLLALLAASGAVACGGGGDSPTKPDTTATSQVVTLTVAVGNGVIGSPSSTGPYARGTSLAYAYNAQPGYRDLRVTLDGAPLAAQGNITMDRAHTLIATASPVASR